MGTKLDCGVFWDIENVAVPRDWDAAGVVSSIRSTIIQPNNLEERDFYVACNVKQIPPAVGKSLELMRVNVVQPFFENPVNAADTKIILLISKFIRNWGHRKCAIIVVTGDSDFLDPLIKLKINYDLTVYLVHGRNSFSRELLWCVDASYQLECGTLRETSPSLKCSHRSGFIKFSGLFEDADSYKRVHQINTLCNRIKTNSRVLRIAKGTVWVGYPDRRHSMSEHDLRLFTGIKFLGCLPTLELVPYLWPDNRFKVRNGNELSLMNHYSRSNHIRSPSAPSNSDTHTSIGIKVSTGPGPRRQQNRPRSRTDLDMSVSLRVSGPETATSHPKNDSSNRRDKQLNNQKTEKNETTIRLPRISS